MNQETSLAQKLTLPILIIFHTIGLVGMVFFDKEKFASLSMYNLLLSVILLFVAHQTSSARFARLFVPVFLIGYGVEVLGINTGFPFGVYHYGSALGVKLFDVPLIIGVNWFMLVMGAGFLARRIVKNSRGQIVLASGIMVLVDFPIEQMASKLDYWYWKDDIIPMQNFIGWFVIAVFMQWLFQKYMIGEKNRLAIPYLAVVSVFFLVLNLSL